MLALLPTLLTLLLMFSIEVHKTNGRCDKKFLDVFSLIALTIAGYLMPVIIGEGVMTLGSEARILIFLMLLMLFISPFVIVAKAQTMESKIQAEASCDAGIQLVDDIDSLEVEQRYSQVAAERSCMKPKGWQSSWNDAFVPSEWSRIRNVHAVRITWELKFSCPMTARLGPCLFWFIPDWHQGDVLTPARALAEPLSRTPSWGAGGPHPTRAQTGSGRP